MSEFHQKMIDRLMALRPEIKGMVSVIGEILIMEDDWAYVARVSTGETRGNETRTHGILINAEYLAKWGRYPHE